MPELPGARCRNHRALFDATCTPGGDEDTQLVALREARTEAQAICAACPALAKCRAWVESLPQSRRPGGVVAGELTDSQGWRAAERQARTEYRRQVRERRRALAGTPQLVESNGFCRGRDYDVGIATGS